VTTEPVDAQRPSRKATLARIGAVVVGIALVSVLIINQSRAVFTATTSNPNNAFSAASISLTDDDGGAAMFTVPPTMVPGDVVTGCIDVTYTGTADPTVVKIYRNAYTETDGAADGATLDDALTFNIDKVDSCATLTNPADVVLGTLVGAVTGTDYVTGLDGLWDPAASPGGVTVGYNFEVTFTPSGSSATDNTRMGDTVSNLTFTWETQAGT
jgi:hypothetical protein